MSASDDEEPAVAGRKRAVASALTMGSRKKPRRSNPFTHQGRHFGRSVHAMVNVTALIYNGMERIGRALLAGEDHIILEDLDAEERREHDVFEKLVTMIPILGTVDNTEAVDIGAQVQKGVSAARAEDTKGLKGTIIDWITPIGGVLKPVIARNVKTNRGFFHETTGRLLCPVQLDWDDANVKSQLLNGELRVAADCWPLMLYRDLQYDHQDPWRGLLRSHLLVTAFKHIFTSPSSVDDNARATRAGNARIHGMSRCTHASIAYVATQVRFALSSSSVFSRSDGVVDSQGFYGTVLNLLNDTDEIEEVQALMMWWDRQIFPNVTAIAHVPSENSALAMIKAKRMAIKARSVASH